MIRASIVLAGLIFSVATAVAQTPPAPAPATPAPASPAPASAPIIEDGSMVQLEYTLSDDAGTVLDSNKGQPPLSYTQGDHQLLPGLEKQLAGLRPGQEKKVVLKPDEAFGPVDPAAQTEVAKSAVPPDALVVGAQLMARNAAGEGRPVVVKEIKESTVVVDLNHPLAGKTLVFDIKVLGIEPPSKGGDSKPADPRPAQNKPAESTAPQPTSPDGKPGTAKPTN
jgi:FKBP-type peptidyl-prolyl cis-trans isomerase SlyD